MNKYSSPGNTNLQPRKFPKIGGKFLHPIREQVRLKVWLTLRVAGGLCLLPILLRIHSLPRLLQRLGKPSGDQRRGSLEIDLVVRVVGTLCRLPLFRPPFFPRSCLLQSLALYYGLTQAGYPVQILFGIHKEGEELLGHSWVTVQGKPVAERTQAKVFRPVYSYPSISQPSPQEK